MAHSLSLDITAGSDCQTMVIRDTSIWDPLLPIQNGIVEVQSPLGTCFYPSPISGAGFVLVLGCGQLGVCCESCPPSTASLPDGNYNIKFSVDPNLKTLVEFNYFRTCSLYGKYIQTACATRSRKCNLRPDEYNSLLMQLRGIRDLIDGAKWSAEDCLDVPQAQEQYNEALQLLERYNHNACL